MATHTAQILVGSAHPYHDGIIPSHALYLSENSRPGWILKTIGGAIQSDVAPVGTGVWIPTLETMIDDGILMAVLGVIKDPTIVEMAKTHFHQHDRGQPTELYQDIGLEDLHQLHQECKNLDTRVKMVFTVLEGSHLVSQLDHLNEYRLPMEICVSHLIPRKA